MRICTICKTLKEYYHFGPFGSGTYRWCLECIKAERSITEKCCSRCGKVKEIDNFSLHSANRSGFKSWCKACCAYAQKARRKKSPRKEGAYNATPDGRYRHYTYGATRRGIKFELTLEQFKRFWQQPCAYCAAPIATIGLDRKNSSKGYNVRNIVPCCFQCNRLKSDMPLREWNRWRTRIGQVILDEQRPRKC